MKKDSTQKVCMKCVQTLRLKSSLSTDFHYKVIFCDDYCWKVCIKIDDYCWKVCTFENYS